MISKSNDYSNWIYFKLSNDNVKVFSGKNNSKIYHLIISENYSNWEYRVMDFINYINASTINGAIEITKEKLKCSKTQYGNHTFNDKILRPFEPTVLIHSTSLKAWESIQNDRCLKSWNKLFESGLIEEKNPIGNLLGDPYEFSDYIMLGNGVTCEIVVSSSDKGKIDCDVNVLYQPGVRLYFNAKLIAADGILIRDGAHLKVKEELEYEKYLLFTATSETVDGYEQNWTPKKFAEKADEAFEMKYGYKSMNVI